jgi:hypothetical protein
MNVKAPDFDIFIAQSPADTRVTVNGHDITRSIGAIHVKSEAGGLSQVTLIVAPGRSIVTVQAAIEDVVVAPVADRQVALGTPH